LSWRRNYSIKRLGPRIGKQLEAIGIERMLVVFLAILHRESKREDRSVRILESIKELRDFESEMFSVHQINLYKSDLNRRDRSIPSFSVLNCRKDHQREILLKVVNNDEPVKVVNNNPNILLEDT